MISQKYQAINAIGAAANACANDPQVFEKGAYEESMHAITDAEAFFVDAIEGRILGKTPNPSYMHFDMAVAKLVLLFVECPVLYAQLMANICNGKPLTSYAGFISAHAFLKALTDDHGYVLEQKGDSAVITLTDGYLMGPASLYTFLSRLI